jgi:hypothetical protein
MTIAFAMLVVVPEPRFLPEGHGGRVLHYRPPSELFDSAVQLLYVVCCCFACYDSTWGMMLCAEWGVRSGVVPAVLYERFMKHLDPSGPLAAEHNQWTFRFFETRAVHKPLPARGCFCTTGASLGDRTGLGLTQSPAWDPFYLVDRTVQMLFFGGCCFLYLSQGVLHAGVALASYLSLRSRVQRHGLMASKAMFAALADARERGAPPDRAPSPPQQQRAPSPQTFHAEDGVQPDATVADPDVAHAGRHDDLSAAEEGRGGPTSMPPMAMPPLPQSKATCAPGAPRVGSARAPSVERARPGAAGGAARRASVPTSRAAPGAAPPPGVRVQPQKLPPPASAYTGNQYRHVR